jgi:hypothetical protein
MTEQNQNQNNLNEFNELMEQPAALSYEDVAEKIGIKINDAPDKKDLKDLEISFNFEKIELIKKLVQETQNNLRRISCLLGEDTPQIEEKIKKSFLESDITASSLGVEAISKTVVQSEVAYSESGERVIEGVFNGQNMVGADGKEYMVPANYASKSKLVEGDILKLTINARGNFLFKQIGPIERSRVVGTLEESEAGGYCVLSANKKWRILAAPITYFKGEAGDEVVILIPKNTPSKWAAVENLIKRVAE